MNKDDKYNEIWSTDWNKGGQSTMIWYERNRIASLWKEYHSLKDEITFGLTSSDD